MVRPSPLLDPVVQYMDVVLGSFSTCALQPEHHQLSSRPHSTLIPGHLQQLLGLRATHESLFSLRGRKEQAFHGAEISHRSAFPLH